MASIRAMDAAFQDAPEANASRQIRSRSDKTGSEESFPFLKSSLRMARVFQFPQRHQVRASCRLWSSACVSAGPLGFVGMSLFFPSRVLAALMAAVLQGMRKSCCAERSSWFRQMRCVTGSFSEPSNPDRSGSAGAGGYGILSLGAENIT